MIYYLIAFIYGVTMGSFYNVIAYRILKNEGKKIITGRSYCPSCNTQLKTKDLVPLFSYLSLNGKCRYCESKIPSINFYFELITGIIFVLTYKLYRSNLLTALIIVSLLLIQVNVLYRDLKIK